MKARRVKREEYMAMLRKLPIDNPTEEDMAGVCPHLTREQAVGAFLGEGGYVACPPVFIKYGFQIVTYGKEWKDEKGKQHPPALHYSFAGRTLRSYSDGKSHGDVFIEYPWMDEAMVFAERQWGKKLILDNWVDYVDVYVQDPSDLDDRGHPKTKAHVVFVIDRDLNDIINDHSKPESALTDRSIVVATLDPLIAHEIRGGRGGFTEFNCAYCGSGLGLSGCNGCGHKFVDDNSRCGSNTPLPPKIVKLLREHGHVFSVDPSIAWKKERQEQQLSVRN